MFKKELVFCLSLILMGFLDWLTTIIGILYFGAIEINPLFAGMTKASILAYSGIKLSVVVLTGFLFYKADRIEKMLRGNSHFGRRFLELGYSVSFMTLTFVVASNIMTVVKVL
jgi:hypothetical protein